MGIAALPLAETYRQFLEQVFSGSIREGFLFDMPALPPELELQSRWFAGDFGREFISVDGQKVEIVQFGFWNHSAGPDFSDAVVLIDGVKRAGAIEMDPDVRDWEHHGHAVNPVYDKVVLHLYFTDSGKERRFTRTASHLNVPQVKMNLASIHLGPPKFAEAEARLGRCSFPLKKMDAVSVERLLEAGAQYRMQLKAARFARVAEIHGRDEAAFQAMSEALGYVNNKLAMRVLAQRLPLRHLKKNAADAESLLFGAAGFLNQPSFEEANQDAQPYLRNLWETWWKYRDGFERQLNWHLAGVRPTNHPQRRIGALNAILKEWDGFIGLFDPAGFSQKKVEKFLLKLEHPYWSRHYTLKSKPAAKEMALVGKSRISDMLANIFIPALIRERPELWTDYRKFRAELDNHKVRRAALRLFGDDPDIEQHKKWLFQQQALLQIYDDFCLADESDCEDCPFPEQMLQWV
jgi:hypothetical protein